jgi:hypothetical protein
MTMPLNFSKQGDTIVVSLLKDGKYSPMFIDENGCDKFPFCISLRPLDNYPGGTNCYLVSRAARCGCTLCYPRCDGEQPYIEVKYSDGEIERFTRFIELDEEERKSIYPPFGGRTTRIFKVVEEIADSYTTAPLTRIAPTNPVLVV